MPGHCARHLGYEPRCARLRQCLRVTPDALTAHSTTASVLAVTPSVVSIFDEYARRYTERDVEGVTNLCLWPFLAIRRGEAIHMPDRDAVRDHFAIAIIAYRLPAARWEVDAGRDRHSPTRRALRLRDRALERARRGRAGGPRHLDELPAARHFGRVALPLVHESLLKTRDVRQCSGMTPERQMPSRRY